MLRPRDADAGGPERPGAATTFFGALDPAAQAAFLGLGREEAFAARSTIFLRGDASDCVYFVRSGRIDVCISSPAGRRLVVTHIDADELLGELSMFDGGVRNVDAVAATDVSLLAILREDLVDFLSLRPDAAMAMIMGLCGRARSVLATFEILAQGNAQARLAGCLRLMASGSSGWSPIMLASKFIPEVRVYRPNCLRPESASKGCCRLSSRRRPLPSASLPSPFSRSTTM